MKTLQVMSVSALIAATALLVTSLPFRATDTDDRIESSAKATYIFQTYLKGDDIKFESYGCASNIVISSVAGIAPLARTPGTRVNVTSRRHPSARTRSPRSRGSSNVVGARIAGSDAPAASRLCCMGTAWNAFPWRSAQTI